MLNPGMPGVAACVALGTCTYSGYGDGRPVGKGPSQTEMQPGGNEYVRAEFPEMDFIRSVRVAPMPQPDGGEVHETSFVKGFLENSWYPNPTRPQMPRVPRRTTPQMRQLWTAREMVLRETAETALPSAMGFKR